MLEQHHPAIHLEPYLTENIRDQHDDWSGVTSAATRRKIQNRINARAYRRRRNALRTENFQSVSTSRLTDPRTQGCYPPAPSSTPASVSFSATSLYTAGAIALSSNSPGEKKTPSFLHLLRSRRASNQLGAEFKSAILHQSRQLNHHSVQPSPTTELLLSLACWNVFRAFMHNVYLLSISPSQLIDDSAISRFSLPLPPANLQPHLPPALRPTEVQLRTPHHPAYDVFPDALLRERIILAEEGSYDEDALCGDLIGWPTGDQDPHNGLMVWGEPWRVESWEVSEAFLKRHRTLVVSCKDLIESSNRWRVLRGDKRLVVNEVE